jgi:hypothetical protein
MTYRVPANITAVRQRAWATRRAKYGPRGHKGAYRHGHANPVSARATDLLIDLHLAGHVSEGQLSKALDLHRIEVRRLVDEYRALTGKEYAA